MVAEGYNGFHVCFSKFAGEIFDCDCNVQLSTAIQLFNSDSLFQLPQCNRYFQHSTAIPTFNRDSVFQRSTVIPTFNCNSVFQRSTVIATFNCDFNFQVRFAFSMSGFSCDRSTLLIVVLIDKIINKFIRLITELQPRLCHLER